MLHEMLPLLRKVLNGDNQENKVMILQRSIRHFRIKLASQGFLEESDYLYEAWKAFRNEEGPEAIPN